MNISNESKQLLNILIHKFDKKHLKKGALQQKNNDNIIKVLYNDIRLSYKNIDYLLKNFHSEKKIVEIHSINDIPKTELINSNFVPRHIKHHIYKAQGYIIFKTKIYETEISLYFLLLTNNSFNTLEKFDNYIRHTLAWLKLALLYCSNKR